MSLLTRAQFERHLSNHLDKRDPGLAGRARRRIGFAWDAIIDHMYKKHAERLTFTSAAELTAECAEAIVQLLKSVKDE
jgi:hypothetical protein